MASMCRCITKALRSTGHTLKPSILASVFPSGDFSLGVRSFVQKRPLDCLHRSQLAQLTDFQRPQYFSGLWGSYLLGNSTTNKFIQDQLTQHPPLKQELSTEDVGRILRFIELDVVKRRLQGVSKSCISYAQLLQLCLDCIKKSCEDDGREIIKSLEQSGDILRLGDIVYLHPNQVARAVQSVLPVLVDESCREELGKMEKEKAEIEMESERQVRKEAWCGLGFLSVQTAVLLRLTFWELSWDVMEPICFYLASIYFILGYAFFIRTSRDPTFETFFAARFNMKQSKLMKRKKFNLERYRELQRICIPTQDLINYETEQINEKEKI